MDKLKHREHDFSTKLRQHSVIERLRAYILYQRQCRQSSEARPLPPFGPVSINLDLTSACNFACPHCVDETILNTGKQLKLHDVKRTIDTLKEHGLLSVILLGGGEPTLHKNIVEIITHIKSHGLQVGIVTNGTRLAHLAGAITALGKDDWVRLSLDAATQKTFEASHRPKVPVSLSGILHDAQELKKSNPQITLGYSFVIVWQGLSLNGRILTPNISEMADAMKLAAAHSFDYVSFKPCLIRLSGSQKESLLDSCSAETEHNITDAISAGLRKAHAVAGGRVRILESVNLRAMLNNEVPELKKQPQTCHMQFFNAVVTPGGVFHCPAFRGLEKARLAETSGFTSKHSLEHTLRNTARSLKTFNASRECSVVGCFYHHVNWWVEQIISDGSGVEQIEPAEDNNFFL